MSMTTQCPSCATTFRVTPQQLQSQHGMVRCGRCAMVFDGFKALATLPEESRAEPAVKRIADPIPVVQAPAQEITAVPPEPAPEAAETHDIDAEVEVPVVSESAGPPAANASVETTVEPVVDELPPPDAIADSHYPADDAANDGVAAVLPATPPPVVAVETPLNSTVTIAPRRHGLAWGLGTAAMLVLLGAQFVYLYRGEIAASVPEARPLLTELCGRLHCTVALPQLPRQISIEASDMQAADTANPGLIILTATLRSHAATALGYPALDVVLTNTRDHTVARRIFLPNEYLSDSKNWRAGIAPNAEVTIRLNIDSGDLGAAGFRLELIAAPAT